jgi:hypothetical protein
MTTEPLSIYLNDHLMGATFGVQLFRRAARSQVDRPWGPTLGKLVEEVAQDRDDLIDIMTILGVPRRRYKVLAGGVAELGGRAKSNGGLIRRSSLSDLVELEAMYLGVVGKISGWRALERAAPAVRGLDVRLADLIERGSSQAERLELARRNAAMVLRQVDRNQT